MKVLIAYTTNSGTVSQCAELLAKELHYMDVRLVNLKTDFIAPDDYDAVIVGSSIRFDHISKEVRNFLSDYSVQLMKKPLGLFLCEGYVDNHDMYVEKNFSKDILDHAFSVMPFGGELKSANAHGLDKLIIRIMRKSIENAVDHNEGEYLRVMPEIIPDNICRMASLLKNQFNLQA